MMAATRRRFVGGAAATGGLAMSALRGAFAQERPLRAADDQSLDYPTAQALLFMDRAVRARTGNSLRMSIFAGAQLGEEREVIEQTRRGVIDVARVNVSPLSNVVPELQCLLMPYLMRSTEHLRATLDGIIGEEMLKATAARGLVGLTFYDSGIRSIYTRDKPIRSPSDLAGMRIRVQQSDLAASVLRAMGATPVQMSYSQVLTALNAGIIDGAENNLPTYMTADHTSVARYYSLTEHMAPPEMVVISMRTWQGLSAAHKDAIMSAALDSRVYMRTLWDNWTRLSIQQAAQTGATIVADVDRPAFARLTASIYDTLEPGAAARKFVERIRAAP